MDDKKLTQLLDNIAQQHIPQTIDLESSVLAELQQRSHTTVTLLRYPMRSVASVMLVLLFFATTVYAVRQFQIQDPALDDTMITELNLSQTIDDTTVTLNWAYADANRIVLSYTYAGDNVSVDEMTRVNLIDNHGNRFEPVGAFQIDQTIPSMLSGNAHFDASTLETQPDTLTLQFEIMYAFTFDFTVPFTSGVQIESQPLVEDADISMNLEWAIVTPSMTRVYICYETPTDALWVPMMTLEFDGQSVAREIGASYSDRVERQDDGRLCRGNFFLAPYEQLPDQLTVSVTHLRTATYYSEENMRRAATVFANYGIHAEVVRNEAQTRESYLLSFENLPDDPDLREQIWDEALIAAGEPLEGERLDGSWQMTVDLP